MIERSKRLTRDRLAVFMAAAIVFAPGAGFRDGPTEPRPSDVAAGMLAPTFDEQQVAGYHATGFAKKAQDQERRHLEGFLALAAMAGALSAANLRSIGLLGGRIQRRLRRVASSHAGRGPPQLQLV